MILSLQYIVLWHMLKHCSEGNWCVYTSVRNLFPVTIQKIHVDMLKKNKSKQYHKNARVDPAPIVDNNAMGNFELLTNGLIPFAKPRKLLKRLRLWRTHVQKAVHEKLVSRLYILRGISTSYGSPSARHFCRRSHTGHRSSPWLQTAIRKRAQPCVSTVRGAFWFCH